MRNFTPSPTLLDSLLVSRTNATANGFSQIDLNAEEDDSVALGKQPTAPNSEALNIESNDVGYFMSVQIGTPPRKFDITVDSGSADFWVTADGCQSSTVEGAGCVSDSDWLTFSTLILLGM